MSSSLILHDIRVLFLGQDTSRIIVSSQCCTVMCFGFESLSYHHIMALSSLQSDTLCYPFASLLKRKHQERYVGQCLSKRGDCVVRSERQPQ